jgi:hypothetical protein
VSTAGTVLLRRGLGCLVLALMAAGCSASDDRPPVCPRVAIVNDATSLIRFAEGAGRDPLDVDFEAEISDLLSGCRIERSGKERRTLVVAVAPVIVATRGPANRSRRANVSYFVSLVDSSQAILGKQVFVAEAEFEGNRRRVVLRQDDPPVTIDIPLAPSGPIADYDVLVGLQLNPSELEFNRER